MSLNSSVTDVLDLYKSPVRRRYLVTSCGVPVLLDQPGGLRNSCQALELITFRAVDTCDMASVIETRPVLARNPGLVCAARRRTGAPKTKLWSVRDLAIFHSM